VLFCIRMKDKQHSQPWLLLNRDELEQTLRDMVKDLIEPGNKPLTVKSGEELLTRKEAAEALKVSLPTLHRMTKRGVIKVTYIGNAVRIKRSEIEKH
jgi:excisionase family DNA binding protein